MMAFRRDKREAAEADAWRRFVQANCDLLAQAGVPQSIFETRTHFDQLLMHGYVHGHPTRISVEQLRPDQRELLAEAVVRYLRAGFGDPGIGFFGQDVHDDICRRADLE